jgi:hypothetical protein
MDFIKIKEANQKILNLIDFEENCSIKEFKKFFKNCDINIQNTQSWNGLTPIMFVLKWNKVKKIGIEKKEIIELLKKTNYYVKDNWGYNVFHYILLNKESWKFTSSIIQEFWNNVGSNMQNDTVLKLIEDFEIGGEYFKQNTVKLLDYIFNDLEWKISLKVQKKIQKNQQLFKITQNIKLYHHLDNKIKNTEKKIKIPTTKI